MTESYRIEGHYAGEPEVYRTRAEVEEYRKLDPIPRFRTYLIDNDKANPDELNMIDVDAKKDISDAVQFAKTSPTPDPTTAMEYIYA